MSVQEKVKPALPNRKPLQTILVKPAGPDCNMACAYCFYLKKGDLFGEPSKHRMPDNILEELIQQGMRQAGREINFTWQGGEPLLMGLAFYQKAIEFQRKYGSGQTVGNGLQTNGLLIDDDWVQFLQSTNWLVGLSLDGPQHVHDRYRRTKGGKSTWKAVVCSAEKLLEAGVAVNALTVVNDYSVRFPEEIYLFHKGLGLKYMQFVPCVETQAGEPSGMHPCSVPAEAYGTFLCKLFDLWIEDFVEGLPTTSVRIFDSLLHHYLGLVPPECSLQEECGTYLVVEHNGDVYSCDFFVEPSGLLGNLGEESLLEMLNGNIQTAFGHQKMCLPTTCKACRWLVQCRGGCTKDRLAGSDERRKNYLCASYNMFFEYSDERLRTLADQLRKRQGTSKQIDGSDEKAMPDSGKVGRNVPCLCGSGKKHKKCCGR